MSNRFLFILAICPMRARTTRGEGRGDGWLLLTVPFYRAESLADLKASYPTAPAMEHRRAGRREEALAWFERAFIEAPTSYAAALNHATGLMGAQRYAEARIGYLTLLPRKPLLPFHHFMLLNNIAWADVMLASPELLDEANERSKVALKAFPKCAPFQGTRGYVLLRRGCVSEGMALLREAYVMNSESQSRATNACCLALGHMMQGQRDEAQSMLTEARNLDLNCEVLPTVEKEIVAIWP